MRSAKYGNPKNLQAVLVLGRWLIHIWINLISMVILSNVREKKVAVEAAREYAKNDFFVPHDHYTESNSSGGESDDGEVPHDAAAGA